MLVWEDSSIEIQIVRLLPTVYLLHGTTFCGASLSPYSLDINMIEHLCDFLDQ